MKVVYIFKQKVTSANKLIFDKGTEVSESYLRKAFSPDEIIALTTIKAVERIKDYDKPRLLKGGLHFE